MDQTQSTRFEVSDHDHNKSKTSFEVELDSELLILTIVGDIQALLGDSKDELKIDSDEEMLEASEDLAEEFLQSANEGTQHHHSTKKHSEEPISTEHRSPSPKKDDPESSKAKMSVDSPNALDYESSSCSKTFKPFDNYMPVTERVL
ncbi:hypothetical protein Tco_1478248, partial [Tanacetum coccineum]